MATVCYSRNNLYSRPFILIVSQIIISNLISFIPYMTVLLPEILLSKKYALKTTWINHSSCTIYVYSSFVMLHFSFVLTLNRFVAIVLPKFNVFLESSKLYFLFLFVWLTAFAISSANLYYCTRNFEVSTLYWVHDCTKQSGGKLFFNFIKFWAIFLSITMLAMYSAIIRNIRRRFASINNETQKKYGMNTLGITKYERSMLIQAALTSGGLIIGAISFSFLSKVLIKIFDQKALLPINISHCLYIILYRCTLSTAFFLTNECARKYLCLRLRNNVVKPISQVQQNKLPEEVKPIPKKKITGVHEEL
uniref:G-protein coupled receptors family 1 profile domain-containing protein n=1 Tax=Wuchereria bancrofti TaxID=6293 RepID=A0AAF5Q5S5_WUCBA